MKVSINDVRRLVNEINEKNGFNKVEYNTIGALHLYSDSCGLAIDKIMNESGGVSRLAGGGLTKNEAYYYLVGMDTNN